MDDTHFHHFENVVQKFFFLELELLMNRKEALDIIHKNLSINSGGIELEAMLFIRKELLGSEKPSHNKQIVKRTFPCICKGCGVKNDVVIEVQE